MFTRRKKEEEEYIFNIEFLLKNIKNKCLLCINIKCYFYTYFYLQVQRIQYIA